MLSIMRGCDDCWDIYGLTLYKGEAILPSCEPQRYITVHSIFMAKSTAILYLAQMYLLFKINCCRYYNEALVMLMNWEVRVCGKEDRRKGG